MASKQDVCGDSINCDYCGKTFKNKKEIQIHTYMLHSAHNEARPNELQIPIFVPSYLNLPCENVHIKIGNCCACFQIPTGRGLDNALDVFRSRKNDPTYATACDSCKLVPSIPEEDSPSDYENCIRIKSNQALSSMPEEYFPLSKSVLTAFENFDLSNRSLETSSSKTYLELPLPKWAQPVNEYIVPPIQSIETSSFKSLEASPLPKKIPITIEDFDSPNQSAQASSSRIYQDLPLPKWAQIANRNFVPPIQSTQASSSKSKEASPLSKRIQIVNENFVPPIQSSQASSFIAAVDSPAPKRMRFMSPPVHSSW